MKKVEAIIQPHKFDDVKNALLAFGVGGMTVSEVRGHGRQKGHTGIYRGQEYAVDLLPKTKLELVVTDEDLDGVIRAICASGRTGKVGDGKVFVTEVLEAIRIRNGERGKDAL